MVEGVLTYVGSYPRGKVLSKIMYLDLIRFNLEDPCLLDHQEDKKSQDYIRALSKGAPLSELQGLRENLISWRTWVNDVERTGPNGPSDEEILSHYLELLG